MTEVHIVGVGIHPFRRSPGLQAIDLGLSAMRQALSDASITWPDVEFVIGGSMDGGNVDSVLRQLPPTGLQVTNIINGCATGGISLWSAYSAIKAGIYDVGVALGYDKHEAGAFNRQPSVYGLPHWYGQTGMMVSVQYFAMRIRRYMEAYGISQNSLALTAQKAFENASQAPHAWRRDALSLETINEGRAICDPLTKYMICSPGEGGAAAVLMSGRKMRELGLNGPRLRGVATSSRPAGSFDVWTPMIEVEGTGQETVNVAAQRAFEMAGVGPDEIDIAQLQDTDAGSEIVHIAEVGFCADGEQERWIQDGQTKLTGRLPVNTDGGCLACGEPIGASGLRQVYENVQQLRGRAGGRQVSNPRLALSQVYGAPGISNVVILEA